MFFSSNVDVYGFQFKVSGVTLTGASGDLSDVSFSEGTGMVLGLTYQLVTFQLVMELLLV